MERSEVKTEWEKPERKGLDQYTPEELKALLEYRSELFENIAEHYKALVEAIYKLPIHVIYRQHAFFNIDQGWHWVKNALDEVWDVPAKAEAVVGNVVDLECSKLP